MKGEAYEKLVDRLEKWQLKNFGKPTEKLMRLGMIEEVGELAHAVLKSSQGIRGYNEDSVNAIIDACCDAVIFSVQCANAQNISPPIPVLYQTLQAVDWQEDIPHAVAEMAYYASGPDPDRLCAMAYLVVEHFGRNFLEELTGVVNTVTARDWKKFPTNGVSK
jgi:NTP pyrophosphatase (non-canonical NTP hydrolase)